MSQELERVYTINLGKVKISQSQHRAVRAINMIREFAQHHMKVETIKIEEELAHEIWARGVRNPPRKVRVRMSKTDEGYVLVTRYDEDAEAKVTPEKETKKVSDKVEEPAKEAPKKEEPSKEAPKKEEPSKEAPKKEEPSKEAPKKEEPAKEAPKKEEPAKEAPKKEEPAKEAPKKD
ncbi:50S ribosomal protein L31 [Nitrosopumilus cobalaminigenes]|uniref:Large ribosomal subunit protein eL31 n=1 Tax=Nitrosopumilus cobalaminigenes TaxID=1470066 RepID=A0A7D5M2P0_9ARCH|nr:50S ribosomal protein L31e [Nitrosopumilus cobalaminigenes]QLH03287.1 50S ribosomal protein L31 [Nitrosopumilus cobalaminigenes]